MRILYINDFDELGGAEVVVRLLVREIGKHHTVRLVSGKAIAPRLRPWSYVYSFGTGRRLRQVLWEFKPHVVHLANYCYRLSPSVLAELARYKRTGESCAVVHTAHDMHLLSPNSGMVTFRKHSKVPNREPLRRPSLSKLLSSRWDHRGLGYSSLKLLQWTLSYRLLRLDRVFDHIVAPSAFLAKALSGVYPGRLSTIRNPVTIPVVLSNFRSEAADKHVRLVFAGRLSAAKGIRSWIAKVDLANWDKLHLIIFGDGPDRRAIEELADEAPRKGRIALRGYVEHATLLRELPDYDALLLPSFVYENAPVTIVEAAATGLHTLCSNHGGMRELADLCGGGYYFEPDSSESVNQTLRALCNDIRRGLPPTVDVERIGEELSMTQFVDRHKLLYRALHTGDRPSYA